MEDRICICILNFNNGLKTILCLKSIFVQTYKSYQVAIIDNSSGDDSVEAINKFLIENNISYSICCQNDPINKNDVYSDQVVLLMAANNGGYSTGNNIGIRYARETGNFTHILILNNDVVLPENFLKEIKHAYDREKTARNSQKIAMGAKEATKDGKIKSKGFYT